MRVLLFAFLALLLVAFAHAPRRLLIYNGSPSVPAGFYVRRDREPRLGDYVTVRASRVARSYAAQRHFNGPRDYFIKRVAALAGERACAHGDVLDIGVRHLPRLRHDVWGRPLPAWGECRTLSGDEFFLLGDTAQSFDSRYWGPVRRTEIEGVWSRFSPR